MSQDRSCEHKKAPPSGLGEGGQVTEEMIEAAARRIERFGWPYRERSRGVAKVMLEAALPLSPLSRRVEAAERALVRFGMSQEKARALIDAEMKAAE